MAGMGYAMMGPPSAADESRCRSGAGRHGLPAARSGAIHGARGILINITGSASLKLSEVNEASTLIQSAAHEDANIIFGAVLDDTMGEDVKITVIATGFRQGSPERREQMLSSALHPEALAPQIESRPPTTFRQRGNRTAPASHRPPGPHPGPGSSREFVSAFRVHDSEAAITEVAESQDLNHPDDDAEPALVAVGAAHQAEDAATERPSFIEEPSENLDIPAFLRKGAI